MTTLHHSARTTVPHMEVQYLNVTSYFEDSNASLTVSNYTPEGRRESKATIYLSPEQWGELAVIAAAQAKKNLKDPGAEYLTHNQLFLEQAKQRSDKHEKDLVAALMTIKRWAASYGDSGWTLLLSGHSEVTDDLVNELIEKGMLEFKRDRYPNGRPKVSYRLTSNGEVLA